MNYRAITLAAVLAVAACGEGPAEPSELDGGILASFRVEGEVFKLWVTNEETTQQILDIVLGTGLATIPNGPLVAGPGPEGYNAPFSWHLDPELTEMAEATIEVCSGLPSFVEEDLDTWLNVVGQYCPWSAELISVEDFR